MNMRPFALFARFTCTTLVGLIAAHAAIGFSRIAAAHEGHAALPSTGAIMDGDKLLLSPAAIKAIGMQTGKVSLADLRDVLRLNARVELPWRQHAIVSTLMPGRVTSVLVKPGESVAAGQKLAELESLELESLQIEMLQADEALRLTAQLLKQRQQLAKNGAIAGSKLLETQADFQEKTAILQIAIRKLQAIGITQEALEQVRSTERPIQSIDITASLSGTIKHATVSEGQFVQETDHLFEIVDLSSLWIVGEVLEADISRIHEGMPIQVAFSGHKFDGVIRHIRLKMDKSQRTVGVVIPVENPQGQLRPGMFGRMAIEIGTAKESIVCPVDALLETGTESFVLLRQGEGKYVRRNVKVGMRTRGQVEILSGLFPGDRVIVVGTQLLAAMFESHSQQPKTKVADTNKRTAKAANSSPTSNPKSSTTEKIVLQGTIELPTHQKTFATTLIEGRIARILVEPGQQVTAGDVLAEVDSLQLRNMQLDLLQARVKAKWAEETARRIKPLAEQGITAARELWELESELKTLRQTIDGLKRKLALIGLSDEQIERIANDDLTASLSSNASMTTLPIRAPSSGQVAEFDFFPGEAVQSQDKLFEIHDMSTIWVEGYVFDKETATIREGQQTVVSFAAHPGLKVKGTIARLAPVLDASERVLPVWIELQTSDKFFREGMFARVELESAKSPQPPANRVTSE